MRRAVRARRAAEGPSEARGERADAPKPDQEADVRDASIGAPQERGCSLEPPREQVLVRRLTEAPSNSRLKWAVERCAARASAGTSRGSR